MLFKNYRFSYLAMRACVRVWNNGKNIESNNNRDRTTVNAKRMPFSIRFYYNGFRIVNIIHWGAAGFHDDCVMYMFVLVSRSTFFSLSFSLSVFHSSPPAPTFTTLLARFFFVPSFGDDFRCEFSSFVQTTSVSVHSLIYGSARCWKPSNDTFYVPRLFSLFVCR